MNQKLNSYPRPPRRGKFGAYWTPTAYNSHVDQRPFAELAQRMGVCWATLGDDGDGSCCNPNPFQDGLSPVALLLTHGIMPVIRMMEPASHKFNARNEHGLLLICQEFVRNGWTDGVYFFWQNECESKREWGDGEEVPADWLKIVWRNFVDGAYEVKRLEAKWKAEGLIPESFHICVGTPALTSWRLFDSTGKRVNPFLEYMTEQERHDLFVEWFCWLNIHNYCKNHPFDYPDDEVTQTGKHMTDEEYAAIVAEVQESYRKNVRLWVFDWWVTDAAHVNFERDRGVSPGLTIDDDDVCFRMYRGANMMLEAAGLLEHVVIGSSEGGSVVDNLEDGRWPRVTAQEQIRQTDAILTEMEEVPNYFFLNHWILGVHEMGVDTKDSYEGDALLTHRHDEVFGLDGRLPLVDHMIERNEGGIR